jgi:hypothetical protein
MIAKAGVLRMTVGVLSAWSSFGCAPRLPPLAGAPVQRPLPPTGLPDSPTLVVLEWELQDPDLAARGEAAARLAPPDSARLDFFLGGGMGHGAAIVIGDAIAFPSTANDMGRRLVPPVPLLWAALGRLSVPPALDTVVRVDSDALRADIGRPVAWRATFVRDSLWRLERVEDGRVVESVQRVDATRVRYRHERRRRQLDLRVTRLQPVSGFDETIWIFP